LRALGVTSLTRSTALPEVPTINEAGIKGFEATAWFGLYAPGRLAPELRQKISSDVLQALHAPRIKSQFAEQGAEPGNLTQAQFAAFVDAEIAKWSKVITDANIRLE
jgi:tripartite-type tricarboxylate transporter receptor subunit TctC